MAETVNTAIDPEQQSEPEKPVRLNRQTVLTVGASIVAVLFLGLNLGLRGFSKDAGVPTNSSNENLLVTPKSASGMPNVTYEDVTRLPVPEPETPQKNLLLPQGTKIFGRYNADVGYAQNRLQIVWDRLIMPNGNSIQLEAMVGADKTGAAGLKDGVDYHISSVVGTVLLSSIIGAGANLVTDSSADGSFVDDLGDAAAQQAATVGSEIVSRQLDFNPPSPSDRASGSTSWLAGT